MPTRKVSVTDPETGRRVSIEATFNGDILMFEDPTPREVEGVALTSIHVVWVNDPDTVFDELERLVWEQYQIAPDDEVEEEWANGEVARYERLANDLLNAYDPETGILPEDFQLSLDDQAYFNACRELQLDVLGMPWALAGDNPPWERGPGFERKTMHLPVVEQKGSEIIFYVDEEGQPVRADFYLVDDEEAMEELKRLHETRPDLYKALPLC